MNTLCEYTEGQYFALVALGLTCTAHDTAMQEQYLSYLGRPVQLHEIICDLVLLVCCNWPTLDKVELVYVCFSHNVPVE